jgi:hypothetical protein
VDGLNGSGFSTVNSFVGVVTRLTAELTTAVARSYRKFRSALGAGQRDWHVSLLVIAHGYLNAYPRNGATQIIMGAL